MTYHSASNIPITDGGYTIQGVEHDNTCVKSHFTGFVSVIPKSDKESDDLYLFKVGQNVGILSASHYAGSVDQVLRVKIVDRMAAKVYYVWEENDRYNLRAGYFHLTPGRERLLTLFEERCKKLAFIGYYPYYRYDGYGGNGWNPEDTFFRLEENGDCFIFMHNSNLPGVKYAPILVKNIAQINKFNNKIIPYYEL